VTSVGEVVDEVEYTHTSRKEEREGSRDPGEERERRSNSVN